jgi:hypothetical protein
MRRALFVVLLLCAAAGAGAATFVTGSPSTTNNDDSCDVATLPAATLLLPYFEVDFQSPQSSAKTTLFTVINTTQYPQIARVTAWTDWGYPVLDFNLFLTGYDVQAINLYDILGPRATIAPPAGMSSSVATGPRSLPNNANPNFLPSAADSCLHLPGAIPALILVDVRNALTTGTISSCSQTPSAHVGGQHHNAIGFLTIDLVATCGVSLPAESAYYNDLLYDNVLTGDYEWIDPNAVTGNYAGGNPLVHIRAVPEGGPAGMIAHTNLPYTFYDRFTPATSEDSRAMDRRQPLPSAFASRWIQGGTGAFNTSLMIWREGVLPGNATCPEYGQASSMRVADVVRFDEHENPTVLAPPPILAPPTTLTLPQTSSTATSSGVLPPMSPIANDVAGWMYLNLNNGGSGNYSAKSGRAYNVNGTVVRPSQNWVVTSMTAEGRYQAAFDATVLANGCTPAPPVTTATVPIGPGPNVNP